MLLIDFEEGRIIEDDEIKRKLAAEHPYESLARGRRSSSSRSCRTSPEEQPGGSSFGRPVPIRRNDPTTHLNQQQAFGYTLEDIQFFLEPMARDAEDPVGFDGHRHPDRRTVETSRSSLYNYFKAETFAQGPPNPPIDPIPPRRLVMVRWSR